MTWYLTIRSACIVAFIAGFCCLTGAAGMLEEGNKRAARRWTLYGFAFAAVGCLLIGLGWTPEHP